MFIGINIIIFQLISFFKNRFKQEPISQREVDMEMGYSIAFLEPFYYRSQRAKKWINC